ncbi:hypothetical protein TH53_21210 [Pedobacter lusitanus]|uniref:BD-FAE-like domain-containing protein n=1 Tax=Pedobacter lusitanus TaxID=1503925 RepID=A0A0D0GDE5_9SPHI|nr:alpha/beta hydrolase [Pedobacter lusitanus]KIO75332.1 hypothetical protein TH53_21210 [Pedobacter lusitanus]
MIKQYSIFILLAIALASCKKTTIAPSPVAAVKSEVASLAASSVTYQDGWNNELHYLSPKNDPQNYDIWLPAKRDTSNTRLFVFIHGGSFLSGDKRDSEFMTTINSIIKEFPDCAIATINYRLGVMPLSDQSKDVENAISQLISESKAMQISNKQIVLIGESAGGYFAFYEGLKKDTKSGNQARYKAIVSLSGFAQMLPLTDASTSLKYRIGIAALSVKVPGLNYDAYSPVNRIAELKGLPELYLFYGGKDDQISPQNSKKIVSAVEATKNTDYIANTYIRGFAEESHVLGETAKSEIAVFLKEKIKFKAD